MPHLFPRASHEHIDDTEEVGSELERKASRRPSFLKSFGSLLRRHNQELEALPQTAPTEPAHAPDYFLRRSSSVQEQHLPSRRAVPSLPRPQTFHRQESERREKLLEVPPTANERRAASVDRRRGLSASAARRPRSPKPGPPLPSISAPEVGTPDQQIVLSPVKDKAGADDDATPAEIDDVERPPSPPPEQLDSGALIDNDDDKSDEIDQDALQQEYERSWILNLSMHFRDKSNREKFFVTYAEKLNKWRRLTVSLDYRSALEGSLEHDLSTLHYQRDKSLAIFKAIRESLPDIQYYDTVTNLKLETTPEDGQLHVHVREDANEIVHYPSVSLMDHVECRRYRESELEFESHLSGFVYKVRVDGRVLIKKEIPGPDTVDEFLYEVNALDSLFDCDNVVELQGLITDEAGEVVKGLLISYASKGALVDMLYDYARTDELPWHRREKWAKQIVTGLSEIHEAGFVQGDFTLSNIVIDEHDDAYIIDINRRGCPVGWEPPELGRLIDSGQRIGMCIGVKTDLFQLGMVLWALAEEVDEPERMERPLDRVCDAVPGYFRRIVETCLSERPQGRATAKKLLRAFPSDAGCPPERPRSRPSVDFRTQCLRDSDHSNSMSTSHRSDKEYIDPKFAVTLDEVQERQRRRADTGRSDFTSGQVTYVDPDSNEASTSYQFESNGSWVVGRRGRSPVSSRRRRSSPLDRTATSATSLSSSPIRRVRSEPKDASVCSAEDNEQTAVGVYPSQLDPKDLTATPERQRTPSPGHAYAQLDPKDLVATPERQRTPSPAITNKHLSPLDLTATPERRRSPSPALVNNQLAAVQSQDSARSNNQPRQNTLGFSFPHQDSGFDETMLEDLQLEDAIVPESNQLVGIPLLSVNSVPKDIPDYLPDIEANQTPEIPNASTNVNNET